MGTVQLLNSAVRNNIERLVFASTVYVYSREGGFYRCSKQACENYIEEFRCMYGLNYTILRYGSLYGPRADESNGIYRLLKEALTKGTRSEDHTSELQSRGHLVFRLLLEKEQNN